MTKNYNYRIFADAAIDIDASYIKSEEIKILPVKCYLSDYEMEITGHESEEEINKIYARQRNGELTRTTSLKKEDFIEMFEPLLRHGLGILYISVSSMLSNAFDEALKAKQMMERKYGKEVPMCIVNTLSATGGFGIAAERAIYNKQIGLDLQANANDVYKMSGHIKSWFYVNDLEYLRKNGKTSAGKSFIGTLLGIKPIMEVSPDGALRQIDKKFGSKKACELLKDLYMENGRSDSGSNVYITHSDDYESALRLKKMILSSDPNVNIKIKTLSPIIGANTGAGIISLHHYHS